jgi:hypothetical protein
MSAAVVESSDLATLNDDEIIPFSSSSEVPRIRVACLLSLGHVHLGWSGAMGYLWPDIPVRLTDMVERQGVWLGRPQRLLDRELQNPCAARAGRSVILVSDNIFRARTALDRRRFLGKRECARPYAPSHGR